MNNGIIFKDFKESKINFESTFKFLIGTNRYDPKTSSKWCDRVLYKTNPKENLIVEAINYKSLTNHNISDHKPVSALFNIQL